MEEKTATIINVISLATWHLAFISPGQNSSSYWLINFRHINNNETWACSANASKNNYITFTIHLWTASICKIHGFVDSFRKGGI